MIQVISEKLGRGRLGRHVEHDERSRAFAVQPSGPVKSVKWTRHCPPFDQGDVGSCTGNAMAGAAMTDPLFSGDVLGEAGALSLYEAATRLDHIAGHYPPSDTGSTGLAVAKAAQQAGLVSAYHHAFSFEAAIAALSRGPVIIGIHWYEGFDKPLGDDAQLVISGDVRGGHEVELNELDVENGFVRGPNSWGVDWGNGGYFCMAFETFRRLLKEQGDAILFVR